METSKKIAILADAAKYDASCASSGAKRKGKKGMLGNNGVSGICHSYTPDGRCVSLLKILFTNHCIFDCQYCINRISSNTPRATFTVEEVVKLTIGFYKRNFIEGLFLSSGILKSPDYTMNLLTQVAKKLRLEEGFNGYIHLKAVADASAAVLAQASLWADRLSANIELPEQKDLEVLAPGKTHHQIHQTMSQLQAFKKDGLSPLKKTLPMAAQKRIPAGQSTQMIVGASPSNDRSILLQSNYMYQSFRLKRVYYSGFSPIQDSHPFLPSQPPALVREHRLYQADWLMRFYQFSVDEITPSSHSSLDLQIDPKLMWAMRNRSFFPVNINFATQFQLLRVPGLGVRNVQRIIKARRFRALTLHDLKKMKVQLGKAKFFIQTADKNPYLRFLDRESFSIVPETQLSLFSERYSSLTGEV